MEVLRFYPTHPATLLFEQMDDPREFLFGVRRNRPGDEQPDHAVLHGSGVLWVMALLAFGALVAVMGLLKARAVRF
jgi:hypothetical protein